MPSLLAPSHLREARVHLMSKCTTNPLQPVSAGRPLWYHSTHFGWCGCSSGGCGGHSGIASPRVLRPWRLGYLLSPRHTDCADMTATAAWG